jgi:hypothetical protein
MLSEIGENPCREDSRKLLQLIPTILHNCCGFDENGKTATVLIAHRFKEPTFFIRPPFFSIFLHSNRGRNFDTLELHYAVLVLFFSRQRDIRNRATCFHNELRQIIYRGIPARENVLFDQELYRGMQIYFALKQIGFVFKISAASRERWFYGKDHASNPSDNNLKAKTLVSGTSTMVLVSLLTFLCLRPSSLLLC